MDIGEFNRNINQVKRYGTIKECFHHNKTECLGKVKQAHSIQRNGRLSVIEAEVNKNLSVYSFSNFRSDESSVMAELIPIGKKEASTFYGFCDYHDSKLFSPIENFAFDPDSEEQIFLHSYRSFAHSYHRKKEELNYWENVDRSKYDAFVWQQMRDYMQWGNKIAVQHLEKGKLYLDEALTSSNYGSLEYIVYRKEGLYPFAVSSQMSPKVTYSGISMNNHENPNVPYENPMITLLPDVNATIAIVASFPFEKKSTQLISELENLNDFQLEVAITSLIIANCENTFFSPLFWNKIGKKGQAKLLEEFRDNATPSSKKYDKKFFKSSFNFFDDKFEISNLKK